MAILDKIGEISFARIGSFFGVFAGIIIGLVFALLLLLRGHSGLVAFVAFLGGIALMVVAGGIYGLVTAWLYNIAAKNVGGVKLGISKSGTKKNQMAAINSIDMMSYAKVASIIAMILVLIIAVIFILVNSAVHVVPVGILVACGIALVAIIVIGIAGFIGGALTAIFYNFAVEKMGPVKLNLQDMKGAGNKNFASIDYMSYAKVYVVIVAIWSIIDAFVRIAVVAGLGSSFTNSYLGTGIGFSIIGAVFGVVFSVIIGFICALLVGIIYNAGARRLGGVELRFSQFK